MVDGGRVIKRMRPAPQGRGYRVRKRSNHVTLIVDNASASTAKLKKVTAKETVNEETTDAAPAKKAAAKKAPVAKKAAPKKAAVKKTKTENE